MDMSKSFAVTEKHKFEWLGVLRYGVRAENSSTFLIHTKLNECGDDVTESGTLDRCGRDDPRM